MMTRLLQMSLATALSVTAPLATQAETFKLWDLDENQIITQSEIEERLMAVMTQFDKDGDGALNAEEYDAFDAARAAEAEEHKTSLSLRAVTGLSRGFTDTNFDGVVTREELLAAGQQWFKSMDRNGDGQIDSQDFTDIKEFTDDG